MYGNYNRSYSPRLPVEVLERIVQFIPEIGLTSILDPEIMAHKSKVNLLRAFALTCRDLLPISRFLLYVELDISSTRTFQQLVATALSSPVISTIPKRITVRDSHTIAFRSGAPSSPWIDSTFYQLPVYFHSFAVLAIKNLEFKICHPGAAIFFSRYEMVTRLELCSVSFSSFEEFRRLVVSFTNLKELLTDGLRWSTRLPPTMIRRYRRTRVPSLANLSYRIGFHDDIPRFHQSVIHLFATPVVSPLHTLRLEVSPSLSAELATFQEALSTLFLYCRNSLSTLKLVFYGAKAYHYLAVLELQFLPRLSILELGTLSLEFIPTLLKWLSTIPSNKITTICLQFAVRESQSWREAPVPEWKSLDEFLSGRSSGFRCGRALLRVDGELIRRLGRWDIADFKTLQSWFPLSDAAGILGEWRQ